MSFPEYLTHDGVALSEMVRDGQVSSDEVLEAAIERIEAVNPRLNAVIDRLYARARAALARGLPRGPLSGVPFLLKDTLELEGTRVTFGSAAARNNISQRTHELARRHEAAGLVILGRTNMSEVGLLPTTEPALYGSCKNPWRLDHSAGGSSGGSAAAVAARMVPLAHADDGGGSIRIPASACGLFGLKPSRGRNPGGDREPPLGFIQTHCVSRSVRDSALLLDLTHGSRPGDADWAPPPPLRYREAAERDPASLRIAFTTRDFAGNRARLECRQAVQVAAELCAELGHHVEEAAPAIDGAAYNEAFLVLWGMCAGYFVKAVARGAIEQRALPGPVSSWLGEAGIARVLTAPNVLPFGRRALEPFTRRLVRIDRKHSPADVWTSAEVLQQSGRRLGQFLERYDLLLSPVLGEPPWKLGTFRHEWSDDEIRERLMSYVGYTQICNTAGLPAMSVPLHLSQAGLPIGVQFVAPFAREHQLFALAGQLERARPWASRLPPEV